jgi:hypothetical protein
MSHLLVTDVIARTRKALSRGSDSGALPMSARQVVAAPATEATLALGRKLEAEIQRLTMSQVHDLSIEIDAERIVLRGRCETYYTKQVAQQTVIEHLLDGVLTNEIVVADC